MEPDIPAALQDLAKIAKRIAELREWQKLAQQERDRNAHPMVFIPNSDQQEIDTLCGSFMILDLTVHEALDLPDSHCSLEQKKEWLQQLHELERTVAILG